ncbi:hypothetical protein OPW36_06185 [Vibrio europaeus]|uniref:hypothetical protein n=1 Tax=Vibrio europaeus TaxID=300876 RepID=UPI00233E6DAA|nr:hypothetical protein [Vibrio europaeus]MDC5824309.1 hypothetical protein [Vibrio europaeus]
MTIRQQEFADLMAKLDDIERALAQSAPDWSSIPAFKKPMVAIQAAEQAKSHIDTTVSIVKAITLNFHQRLTELEEAQHGQ